MAQADPGDLTVRLDRLENALRQLTGTIEQLQYRNQQLEMQLKRMQDDAAPRLVRSLARRSARSLRQGRATVQTCSIRRSVRMRRALRACSAMQP